MAHGQIPSVDPEMCCRETSASHGHSPLGTGLGVYCIIISAVSHNSGVPFEVPRERGCQECIQK